jgi:protein SCO1/2
MPALKTVRLAAWAAVGLVAAGLISWFVLAGQKPGSPAATTVAALSIGGPFELIDQKGETVTEAALQGHPSALFFGYTYCPDVCPTTLADMTVWLGDLGADADRLKVYFVTVDPERDTQEQMASYLEAFDPRIVGLTGPRPAVDQMLQEFRVYSRKVGEDEHYTMDHTASVYLLDDKAEFVGTLDFQENPETALAKLKRLVGT